MADPPKSSPLPSNLSATSGNANNPLSQPSSGSATKMSGIFGSNQNAAASTNPTLFGNTLSTSGPSLFGGSKPGNNPFSSADHSGSSGFGFGPAPTNNASSASSAPPMNFPGLSTPNKTSESSAPNQTQAPSILGGSSITGASFGKPGVSAFSSGQTETSTPASKPNTGFSFATSTTPAGPPPADITGKGGNPSSVFTLNKPREQKSNLFGTSSTIQSANAPSNAFSAFTQSGSSGSIFGNNIPSDSTTPASSPQTTSSIFNKNPTEPGKSLFSKPGGESQTGGGLFSHLNKPNNNESTSLLSGQSASDAGAQSQAAPTRLTSTFFSSSQAPPGGPTNGPGNPIFGAPPPAFSASSSKPSLAFPLTSSAPSNAPSLFGALGAKKNNPEATATSTSGASSSFFPGPTKPSITTTSSSNEPTATSAAGTQSIFGAPATKSSLFGALAPPTDPSASTQPKIPPTSTNTSNNVANAGTNFSTSTAGPSPPTQSRLKNKSMDEIITRWASDLSKYQKDFQRQAERVASWDRMLVENSDKIQKLYGRTLEVERATTEVERQLTAVENDQAELAIWLDHYEKEVNQMTANQVGQGESLQGPDQERERTYQLADKLSNRLQDMGQDLTGMINEINDASSNLSRNNKADDPLSQVVRVLNTHLSQLQEIDRGAASLQAKVAAAQRAGQSLGFSNSLLGPSSDAADGFYRSYMGRR